VSVSWPVVVSQTFNVRSQLAEASRFPSGLNATLVTQLVCPFSVVGQQVYEHLPQQGRIRLAGEEIVDQPVHFFGSLADQVQQAPGGR
jgi:hypothetical protein